MRHPRHILLSVACLAAAAVGWGGEKPATLAPEFAKLLTDAQAELRAGKAQAALDRLSAFDFKSKVKAKPRITDHALRHLLLGHACVQLARLDQAAAAYRKALAMDGSMTQAGIALAQVHARKEQWPEAAELLGRFAATDSCDAGLLLLYAQVAQRLGDGRLCGLLTRKGIVRFPADTQFRRLDLAILFDEGDHAAAKRTVRLFLDASPADPALWQQLAFLNRETRQDADSLVALEAAVLCHPASLVAHRQLLGAQLADGDWLTVVERGQALLAGPLAKAAAADLRVMGLLITAADMGERDRLVGAWLARVAEPKRTRAMHLAAARLALRQGRAAQARKALGRLIEAGEADASVFLWAGHIAEAQEDWPAAETLYGQARRLEGRGARLATLYLARLQARRGRLGHAAELLRQHLRAYPEDAAARSILTLVEARQKAGEGE